MVIQPQNSVDLTRIESGLACMQLNVEQVPHLMIALTPSQQRLG